MKHILNKKLSIWLILFLVAGAIQAKDTKSKPIVLENENLRLEIDPALGGRATSFITKDNKTDLVYTKGGGFFMDHFWQLIWPGEFLKKTYQAKKEKDSVTLSCTSAGKSKPSAKAIPLIKDVEMTKQITLPKGANYVQVDVTLSSPKDAAKMPGYWVQNLFWAGGQKEGETYIRPSIRTPDITSPTGKGNSWVPDVNQGWTAAYNTIKKTGIVFLMDYDNLKVLYNCQPACTTEWRYRKIYIPKEEKWSTRFYAVYVKGLENICFASEEFIAGIVVKPEGKGIKVTYQLAAAVKKVKSVELETSVLDAHKPTVIHPLKKVTVNGLSNNDIKTVTLVDPQAIPDPRVVRVDGTVHLEDGSTVKRRYEYFYVGSYGFGKNIQMDMVSPVYASKKPKQNFKLMKPKKLVRKRLPHPKVYFGKGLFANKFEFTSQITDQTRGGSVSMSKLETGWLSSKGSSGMNLEGFPLDYDNIMAYDAIVLANIPIPVALGDVGMEMLCDYVKNGGALLIYGGDLSLDPAKLKGSLAGELLPVIPKRARVHKLKDGRILPEINNHPVLSMVDLDEPIYCYYANDVEPKPDAEVVLTVDNKPFLILGKYGKGRVAVMAGSVYGKENPGKPAFWQSKEWLYLQPNLLRWITSFIK